MTQIEQIKAEIERRVNAYQKNFDKADNKIAKLSTDGRIASLKSLLSFINSLQAELVSRPVSREDILRKAIKVYGIHAQINMAIEEMGELIVALQHKLRGRASIDEVSEEIADVQIMMEQLALIVGVASVRNFYDAKIQRLEQRLNKEN